jgi:hypothetical protein
LGGVTAPADVPIREAAMFERFTKDARDVVDGAVAHAARTDSGRIEEIHLLLSVLDREGSRGSFALSALGLPPGSGRRDDLVRALPGAGAPAAPGAVPVAVPGTGGRVGGRTGGRAGRRRPFSKDSKALLAGSLRIAVDHHDRRIGDEHLLLALVTGPGTLAGVLAGHGVTPASVTRVLYGDGGGGRADDGGADDGGAEGVGR